ncbi:BREX system P-loop protein BrxC [Capnocytophaga canimorsus]|uniref:BREX system P-loop protein BrxC n=1 Tax=Capnocytophaga canimorsus TaxID=28188 RepID=UPI0038586092
MKLSELYEKEITRHIDPAVVVGDMKEEQIKQEIEEYVFTKGVLENIYTFLDAIVNKTSGKTGVWINGYYGSGKSHFIKYLFYCLNQNTRKSALQRYKEAVKDSKELDDFSDVTLSNVENIEKKINALEVDEIIFNIDSVSESRRGKSVITRVLMKQLNARRGFNSQNIAFANLVEKNLQISGKLEAFKDRIKQRFNMELNNTTISRLLNLSRGKVIEVIAEFDPNIDKVALEDALKDDKEYTIEEFIFELEEYISQKTQNFRLVFLMDEVSQYIGTDSSLLLNLQTIVEEVGSKLGQKVWIVCTAQQDLSALVNRNDGKYEDFGKIMGRFETRISLESQDTQFITQKRLLEKNVNGQKALADFYKENKGGVENQFEFEHSLYKNYQNAEDFYLSYPFVPYQFRLISDVFQSFSAVGFVGEGVKNTERAILGITHFTAKNQKDKELGYFISFDNFYNEQLGNNLTHLAKSILDRAFKIDFDSEQKGFAHRVIKVLFMISNLDDSIKINFPATVENLALLLINYISQVKTELQAKVQGVLDLLVKNNIIQESEGKYRFLSNEGILVANEIKNLTLNEATKLKYFYNQFIKDKLKPQISYNLGSKNIKISISVDDKEEITGGDFRVKFVVFSSTNVGEEALKISASDLNINISEWIIKDKTFTEDFYKYAKTAKYLEDYRSNATGDRVRTLEEFAADNAKLLSLLQANFDKKFGETSYTSKQMVIEGKNIAATTPAQRYAQMLENHAKAIFDKHEWSKPFANTNDELKKAIANQMILLDNGLNIAEEEVNNKINYAGNTIALSELIKQFEKAPYGWKDITVLHIVYNIVKKKHRTLYYQNEEMDMERYFELAINSSSRLGIEIKLPKDYNQDEINAFCAAVDEVFLGESLSPSKEVSELMKDFHEIMKRVLIEVNHYKEEYTVYPFSKLVKLYHAALANIKETKSNEKLMKDFIAQKDQLKTQRDNFVEIKEFITNNIDKYEEIKAFIAQEKNNIHKLGEEYENDYKDINNYINTESKPAHGFPTVLKQYRKLSQAIDELVASFREKVRQIYTQAYDEIEADIQKNELSVEDIIGSREKFLTNFENMTDLNALEVKKLNVGKFKADYQEKIHKAIAHKTGVSAPTPNKLEIVSKISGKTLSSPEEVDAFVEKLRNQLMVELAKGTLILI